MRFYGMSINGEKILEPCIDMETGLYGVYDYRSNTFYPAKQQPSNSEKAKMAKEAKEKAEALKLSRQLAKEIPPICRCKICGKEPELHGGFFSTYDRIQYWVECPQCYTKTLSNGFDTYDYYGDKLETQRIHHEQRKEAILKWNDLMK